MFKIIINLDSRGGRTRAVSGSNGNILKILKIEIEIFSSLPQTRYQYYYDSMESKFSEK